MAADADFLLDLYLEYRSLLQAAQGTDASAGSGGVTGQLVLLTAQGEHGPRRAAAARIAGAAALVVLAAEREAKQVVRDGWCDFLVNSLDEALRILKNEVRRAAAVSVCLLAEPSEVLQECVERGIQPNLLDGPQPALAARGARVVRWCHALGEEEAAVSWTATPSRLRELQAVDRLAADSLLFARQEKLHWLARAPSALGRTWQCQRLLPMHEGELHRFLNKVEHFPYTYSATDLAKRGFSAGKSHMPQSSPLYTYRENAIDCAALEITDGLVIERNGEKVWP